MQDKTRTLSFKGIQFVLNRKQYKTPKYRGLVQLYLVKVEKANELKGGEHEHHSVPFARTSTFGYIIQMLYSNTACRCRIQIQNMVFYLFEIEKEEIMNTTQFLLKGRGGNHNTIYIRTTIVSTNTHQQKLKNNIIETQEGTNYWNCIQDKWLSPISPQLFQTI